MNNPRTSIWNASTITWCNKDTRNSSSWFFFQDPLFGQNRIFLRTLMFGILGVTTPSESFVSELVQAKSALIHRSSVQEIMESQGWEDDVPFPWHMRSFSRRVSDLWIFLIPVDFFKRIFGGDEILEKKNQKIVFFLRGIVWIKLW